VAVVDILEGGSGQSPLRVLLCMIRKLLLRGLSTKTMGAKLSLMVSLKARELALAASWWSCLCMIIECKPEGASI
jgi:hypothetical protein